MFERLARFAHLFGRELEIFRLRRGEHLFQPATAFSERLIQQEFATLVEKIEEHEIKTHVGKIMTATQDLVRNLDAIVWAVNPKNDSLENLVLFSSDHARFRSAPRNGTRLSSR